MTNAHYLIAKNVHKMPKPVKILIVEDEMIIAADLSLTLEEMGYEVDAILLRGEDAVRHCRESTPDLILLDVQLKGLLDGVETARALKAEGRTAPVIYLRTQHHLAALEHLITHPPNQEIYIPLTWLRMGSDAETIGDFAAARRYVDRGLVGIRASPPQPGSKTPKYPSLIPSAHAFTPRQETTTGP